MRHRRHLSWNLPREGWARPGVEIPYSWGVGGGFRRVDFAWKGEDAPSTRVSPVPLPFDFIGMRSWRNDLDRGGIITLGAFGQGLTFVDPRLTELDRQPIYPLLDRPLEAGQILVDGSGPSIATNWASSVSPVPPGYRAVIEQVSTFALDPFGLPIAGPFGSTGGYGLPNSNFGTGADPNGWTVRVGNCGIFSILADGRPLPNIGNIAFLSWDINSYAGQPLAELGPGQLLSATWRGNPLPRSFVPFGPPVPVNQERAFNNFFTSVGVRIRGRWIPIPLTTPERDKEVIPAGGRK